MAASLSRQVAAMDSLAWRIAHEWNRAKDRHLTMADMQSIWRDSIMASAHYQCLAEKRRETIRFFWHSTRSQTLGQNQMYGHWLHGAFYSSWDDLPDNVKYNETELGRLPKGHFWLDGDGKATTIRYFLPSDSSGEDRSHFLAPLESLDAVK